MIKFINTIRFENASEIIHALAEPEKVLYENFPSFKKYAKNIKFNHGWIFRGVCSDAYDLKPSSMRDNFQFKYPDSFQNEMGSAMHISNEKNNRKRSELFLVSDFYRNCVRAGLRVPVFPHDIHEALVKIEIDQLMTWNSEESSRWPRSELFEIFSLAQHYGVPTRLLDWTRNPFVAAFFAAKDAVKEKEGNLAIWLFSSVFAQVLGHTIKVNFIDPPTYGNSNLILQQGVFTLMDDRQDEKCLASIYSNTATQNRNDNKFPPLFKLTLPKSQAPSLLNLLENIGIYSSRIFSGYEGAAKFYK